MSRIFNSKNKSLVKLSVVNAEDIWCRTDEGKYVLNKKLNIFGKIEKGSSSFVVNTNLKGKNHKFVEDTHNLPKNLKNEIVKKFSDENKRVVYLVRK